jgi:exodeoxyribonuclease V beta subunit
LFPPLPLPQPSPPEFILSFSSLSKKVRTLKHVPPHILPLGAETGIILHRIFERILPLQSQIETVVAEEVKGTLLADWSKQVVEIVEKTLQLPLMAFSLQEVRQDKMQQEMEFLFSTKNGLMKGYIDLFFEKDGKYYLVDWKTNYLDSYDYPHLEQAMQEGDYFLQANIYAAALKKYLARFDPRPFEECFGGVCYIFVRAPACFFFS